MTDREHASVHPMQPSGFDPRPDSARAQAGGFKLATGDNAVLSTGNAGNASVGVGRFPSTMSSQLAQPLSWVKRGGVSVT